MTAARLVALAGALLSLGQTPGWAQESAYRLGPKANIRVLLRSSHEGTRFTVNGVEVGQGRTVEVLAEKKQRYEVKAEPPGCASRSDTLTPPFRNGQEILFQFLLADCAPRLALEAAESRTRSVSAPVIVRLQSRARVVDVVVSLNGEKLADQSATLARQLSDERERSGPGAPLSLQLQLFLREGPNLLLVEARDEDGLKGKAQLTIDYRPEGD